MYFNSPLKLRVFFYILKNPRVNIIKKQVNTKSCLTNKPSTTFVLKILLIVLFKKITKKFLI